MSAVRGFPLGYRTPRPGPVVRLRRCADCGHSTRSHSCGGCATCTCPAYIEPEPMALAEVPTQTGPTKEHR